MAAAFKIQTNIRELERKMLDFQKRQIPFAMSTALTAVARAAAADEQAALPRYFSGPTPFTGRAFGVIPATKASQTATLFIKDIQAVYLAPYISGGRQALGSKQAILTPRDIGLNTYGNLPRGKLASLKGRPDIFVGEVKTKSGGTIAGVWQRVTVSRGGRRGFKRIGRAAAAPPAGRLRLLIQFTRPATVTHRFPYEAIAMEAVKRGFGQAFDGALAKALATAR